MCESKLFQNHYIFTQPSWRAGRYTRSIFRFFFSLTCCYSKFKELSEPYYLPEGSIVGFIPLSRVFLKWKQSRSGFELGSLIPFLIRMTITWWVPPGSLSNKLIFLLVFSYILIAFSTQLFRLLANNLA